MLLHFYKMQGAGNDFIIINNEDLQISLSPEKIQALCDRHRGIGADGLLALEPAKKGADFRFRYYNADGYEAEMCGNGARCFALFASHLDTETSESLSFETSVGTLKAQLIGGTVSISMSNPIDQSLNLNLKNIDYETHFINTGVPHCVSFVENLAEFNVLKTGEKIRQHPYFESDGTNANFIEVLNDNELLIRTYERGVEEETLACGTGVVAAAIISAKLYQWSSPIAVKVSGGEVLQVNFKQNSDGNFYEVTLTGPAEFVFEGDIEI